MYMHAICIYVTKTCNYGPQHYKSSYTFFIQDINFGAHKKFIVYIYNYIATWSCHDANCHEYLCRLL